MHGFHVSVSFFVLAFVLPFLGSWVLSCFRSFFVLPFPRSWVVFVLAFVLAFLGSWALSCFLSSIRASVPSFIRGFRVSDPFLRASVPSFMRDFRASISFFVLLCFRSCVPWFMSAFVFPFLYSCFRSLVHTWFSCFRSIFTCFRSLVHASFSCFHLFFCAFVLPFLGSWVLSCFHSFFRACFLFPFFPSCVHSCSFPPSLPPSLTLATKLALVLTICKARRATHLQRNLLEARHNEGRQLLDKGHLLIISKCVQLC